MCDPVTGALLLGGAGVGASIYGANRGAAAIEDASDAAVREQRRQFDTALDLSRPAISAGDTARAQLMRLLGLPVPETTAPRTFPALPRAFRGDRDGLPPRMRQRFGLDSGPVRAEPTVTDPIDIIRNTPGYEFQTEEGRRALNAIRSAGGSSGGDLIRDFTRFNQGVASDFYRDYANRLANIAGTGQTAATTVGNQAIATGAGTAGSILSAGEARASGITGAASGITGLAGELIKILAQGN